jgi:hypothetical protein
MDSTRCRSIAARATGRIIAMPIRANRKFQPLIATGAEKAPMRVTTFSIDPASHHWADMLREASQLQSEEAPWVTSESSNHPVAEQRGADAFDGGL